MGGFPDHPAALAAATNSVPSAPLCHGVSRRVTMKARSPVGPASNVASNCGNSGGDPHAGLLAIDRDHDPSHRLTVDHNACRQDSVAQPVAIPRENAD
jgi:hypothetical protein